MLVFVCRSTKKADSLGRNKWGAYYTSEGIRLVVGNLIIFTIHKNGIWLALDKQLLDKMDGKRDLLEKVSIGTGRLRNIPNISRFLLEMDTTFHQKMIL